MAGVEDSRPKHIRTASRISRPSNKRAASRQDGTDASRDEFYDTITYIRKVLCPGQSTLTPGADNGTKALSDLLPPLTSSNEVDIQLYAIIAVVLEQFVQSWYGHITPDGDFINEVIGIVAHCTTGIEQRLIAVDLEEILLDELPAILITHVNAVTIGHDSITTSDHLEGDVGLIYHTICPNKALSPPPTDDASVLEEKENEIAWSQLLVARILPLVLPPEDLRNPTLHILVSEVFSQLIVFNAICERGSEPWIIWEGITKLIHSLLRTNATQQAMPEDDDLSMDRLEQFGLLSKTHETPGQDPPKAERPMINTIVQILASTLYFIFIAWLLLRSVVKALMHDSSIPARLLQRSENQKSNKLSVTAVEAGGDPDLQLIRDEVKDKRPIVQMRIWSCISRLTLLQQRMPWLYGFVSLLQWVSLRGPGKVCAVDGALDRLMSSEIQQKLLNPELLPRLLLAVRSALFPNNALAPAREPPTPEEALQIKKDCAKTLVEAIPSIARVRYFATADPDSMQEDVKRTLDMFSNQYINKHLIVSAIDLLAVRLFPELGDVIEE